METNELKNLLNKHIDELNQAMIVIDRNVLNRNSWITISTSIKRSPGKSDEMILKEMTQLFGTDCLKALIISVTPKNIEEFDKAITTQSLDLKNSIPIKKQES